MQRSGKSPVLALWLDAADLALVRRWMADGVLPHLRQIAEAGGFATLDGFEYCRAEIMQCVAVTGCHPASSGYWAQHRFDRDRYRIVRRGAYDYERRPPFFALGSAYDVAVVDLPQYRFHDQVHGWQLAGWGAHHPMVDFSSRPPQLAERVRDRYGTPMTERPEFEYATLEDRESMQRLHEVLLASARKRTDMLMEMIGERPWDLFLAAYGESHKGGHYFHPHPGNAWLLEEADPLRHLREIYVEIDRGVGRLFEAFGRTHEIVLFSYEGMSVSADEVKSIFLLPDVLLRHAFRSGAFEFDESKRAPSPEREAGILDWTMEAWNLRRRPGYWASRKRRRVSPAEAAAHDVRKGRPPAPFHPSNFDYEPYQPAIWVSPYWPHMSAFAMPAFTDGQIRVNVEGRERDGRVAPRDYDRCCDEITAMLESFTSPRTGRPMIDRVIRTRQRPEDDDDTRPAADLVVLWDGDPGTHFVSPEWGEIGPVPPLRAGSHPAHGFLIHHGPGGRKLDRQQGHVLDIAATVLDLVGADAPAPLDGESLLGAPTALAAASDGRDATEPPLRAS